MEGILEKKVNFTKGGIQSLAPKLKQYEVRDTVCRGLIVRVNPAGTKTFMYCQNINGKFFRRSLGRTDVISIENARKQADVFRARCSSSARLQLFEISNKAVSFQKLYSKYYEKHLLPHTKRPQDNKRLSEKDVLPLLGHLNCITIKKSQIRDSYSVWTQKLGKAQATRTLNITSAVFNYGIREDILHGVNPCLGVRRFKGKSRDRFLSLAELDLFFTALKDEMEIFRDFFTLCLLIGARKSAMLAMRISAIDCVNKHWRLSEDESTNNDVNIYVLSELAMSILTRRMRTNALTVRPSEFIFPGAGISGHPKRPFIE